MGYSSSTILFHLIEICAFPVYVSFIINCHIGSYYIPLKDGNHACDLCPSGTFMPYVDHKETKCFDCMKIEDDRLEVLVEECDRKHDSVIQCVPGYYRRLGRNPDDKERCVKCTRCDEIQMFEILPCSTYDDTHCCNGENYEVVPNHDGVLVCVERPWLCRQGQYFDSFSYNCLPCPDDTFMPLEYHSKTECFKCQSSSRENLPKHSIIIQPCNSTHQDIIGCKNGFYINHAMGYNKKDIGCSPCKTCDSDKGMYEGRKCSRDHDTVCCHQPNMTVIETPLGPECLSPSSDSTTTSPVLTTSLETSAMIVCGQGQYLHNKTNDENIDRITTANEDKMYEELSCRPCPYGTYMDETSHTKTECKNCTEFQGQHLPGSCPRPVQIKIAKNKEQNIGGIIIGVFFAGILLGVLFVIVLYYFCRRRIVKMLRHRWEFRRQQSNDVTDETELEKLGHSSKGRDPLTTEAGDQSIPKMKNKTFLHELDCEKNSMHSKFIPIKEFNKSHVPEGWNTKLVEKYIMATGDLTLRVNVSFLNNDKPADKTDVRRDSSGFVLRLTREFTVQDGKTCPCKSCEGSPFPKTHWGEVEVIVSVRSVSNDDDASRAIFDLWYDSDDLLAKSPKLFGVKTRYDNTVSDLCHIYCITHDKAVCDKLGKMVKTWDRLRDDLSEKAKVQTNDLDPLVVIISHPHHYSKHVTLGNLIRTEEDPPCRFAYDAQTCLGSLGGPVSILGLKDGSGCMVTTHWGRREEGVNASSGLRLPAEPFRP